MSKASIEITWNTPGNFYRDYCAACTGRPSLNARLSRARRDLYPNPIAGEPKAIQSGAVGPRRT
jgi:hypothetical protein